MDGSATGNLRLPLSLSAVLVFAGPNGIGEKVLEKLSPLSLIFGSHIIWAAVNILTVEVFGFTTGSRPLNLSEGFWPSVLATSVLYVLAPLFFFSGIRSSRLSLSVPYLSPIPAFILLTGALLLKEFIRPAWAVAVISVAIGSWTVQSRCVDTFAPLKRTLKERGSGNALAWALIFSASAVVDKITLNRSSLLMFLFASSL